MYRVVYAPIDAPRAIKIVAATAAGDRDAARAVAAAARKASMEMRVLWGEWGGQGRGRAGGEIRSRREHAKLQTLPFQPPTLLVRTCAAR